MRFPTLVFWFFSLVLFLLPCLGFLAVKLAGWAMGFSVSCKGFLLAAAMLVAGWWMLYLYGHRVGRFQCEVRRADVAIRVPQSFEGYRIVHISDLHLDGWIGHADLLRKRVEQINALRPDLVCFTGDLVSLSSQEIEPFVPILKGIHARDGVVSVLGNHDYLPYARHLSPKERQLEVERIIHTQREQLGWKLLLNDHIIVTRTGESLAILGCENHSVGVHQVVKRGNLAKTMNGTEGMTRILLTHDPSHWRAEVVGQTDIALTLSGHTHAMQLRILGHTPSSFLFPECDGLYEEGGQWLYVNIGLGGTLPMRIGATPEITLITLTPLRNMPDGNRNFTCNTFQSRIRRKYRIPVFPTHHPFQFFRKSISQCNLKNRQTSI